MNFARNAILLLLISASARAEDRMYFQGPAGAKSGDLAKAAAALAKRCTAHGYVGMSAKVLDDGSGPIIELVCKSGITDAMRPTVARLARLPGSGVQIRMGRELTAPERAQFSGGNPDAQKDRAPKGTHWYRSWYNGTFEPSDVAENGRVYVQLLLDEVLVNSADFLKAKWDGAASYTFSPALSKRLGETYFRIGAKNIQTISLVVDGRTLDGLGGQLRWGGNPDFESSPACFTLGNDDRGNSLGPDVEAIIRNPMPFGLIESRPPGERRPEPAADKGPPQGNTLYFKVPDGTPLVDATYAATVLARRCTEYGYQRIKSSAESIKEKDVVVLTCETGWTQGMRENVEFWASIVGQKVEIYRDRRLSNVESEQFAEPAGTAAEILKAPAPEGRKWLPGASRFGGRAVVLVDAQPVLQSPRLDGLAQDGEGLWWYTTPTDLAKKLGAEHTKDVDNVGNADWVVDGIALMETQVTYRSAPGAKPGYGIQLGDEQKKLIILLTKNPLPFALKPVSEAELK